MKKLYIHILLAFCLTLLFETTITSQNIYKKLNVNQCDSLIAANEENPNFVILDVRTNGVWSGDHLLGSINRNFYDADFSQQLDALPKNKLFLIHCQSGGRSAKAFNIMKDLAFAEVYDMIGGMNSWKNNKMPTTKELGPKLMLVNVDEITKTNTGSDTLYISITNRANQILSISSINIDDIHTVSHNFAIENTIEGAEDYTFTVIHTPGFNETETTKLTLNSNGGNIDISIHFKDGLVNNNALADREKLQVYPNPANQFIYFKNIDVGSIKQISVYNSLGQVSYFSAYPINKQRINTSQFKNGLYIVRLETENETIVRKIIIQH